MNRRIHATVWLFLMAVTLLLGGCETPPTAPSLDPRIRAINVDPVVQGDAPSVSVNVVIPGTGNQYVRRVTAEFRSLSEADRPFVSAAGEFSSAGNNQWQGTLPALNLGKYEVKVIVNLRRGPGPGGEVQPAIDTLIEGTKVFDVGPDTDECFNFAANAGDTQGWLGDGYKYYNDGSPVENCASDVFYFSGGLYQPFGASCAPEQQFRVDLLAPDVANRPGWAKTRGVVTRAYWNIAGMTMQPIFTIDNLSPIAPVDGDGDFIFHPAAGSVGNPTVYTSRIDPDGSYITDFRLRFFGPAFTIAPEGFVLIKSVCPIPDRPG
ncbi:MAG: hypothetical protein AAAFM81_15360 [Pseudomonadota bacterium]